jgi:hypothetical protein
MMTDFPPPQPAEWPRCAPEDAGLDADRLAAAVRHEKPWLRDLALMVASNFAESPPWNESLGSVRRRRAERPSTARRPDRRRMGRCHAGRHDLQRRQELSRHPLLRSWLPCYPLGTGREEGRRW